MTDLVRTPLAVTPSRRRRPGRCLVGAALLAFAFPFALSGCNQDDPAKEDGDDATGATGAASAASAGTAPTGGDDDTAGDDDGFVPPEF